MGTAITDKTTPSTGTDHGARLREILEDAGMVMMTTRALDGALHTRPMSVARVGDDGTMYFATSVESAKIEELRADPRADVAFQSRTQYATVHGDARVSQDAALIAALWQDSWKMWFPRGKDDPSIAIVILHPSRGEYWDQSGARGLSFLYRAAKALVTGEPVEFKPEDHGTVQMS
jgi:general stress protein 26